MTVCSTEPKPSQVYEITQHNMALYKHEMNLLTILACSSRAELNKQASSTKHVDWMTTWGGGSVTLIPLLANGGPLFQGI